MTALAEVGGQLAIVDPDTGELRAPGCQQCAELTAKLAAIEGDCEVLEKEHTRLLRRIAALQRVKDAERESDPERDTIRGIFDYWRENCGHEHANFDGARFDLIKARLRHFSPGELQMAIDGAAVDAFVDEHGKKHDRLGLIFQNAERCEDFICRYWRWKKREGWR